jgi:hypothetical protein
MEIERFNGTEEKKEFKDVRAMMFAAVALSTDPTIKKITLHFTRTIPGRKSAKKRMTKKSASR